MNRNCLGFDLRLSFFPCRTTGLICERMKPSSTVRVHRFEEEERPCRCPNRSEALSTSPWRRWRCIVYDSFGDESGQIDIVIANGDQPFTFPWAESGEYAIEGVSAVGEIKSNLTAATLKDCIDRPEA